MNKIRILALFVLLALFFSIANVSPADASLPQVALLGAENGSRLTDIVNKVTAAGAGLYEVTNLSACPLATPSLSTLQQYDAVMVWTDCFFSDSVTFGNVLADYVDGGGHVVLTGHVWWPFTTQGYFCIFGVVLPTKDTIRLTLAPAALVARTGH
jgi:hypothetical protein